MSRTLTRDAKRSSEMVTAGKVAPKPRPADTEAIRRYVHLFESMATWRSGEPAAVTEMRRRGIARFAELGFPTMKNEDWHFTSSAPIAARVFSAPRTSSDVGDTSARGIPGDWTKLVFVNGAHVPAGGSVPSLPRGATASSLATALSAGELDELGTIHDFGGGAFSALNSALFDDGALIRIPDGVELETPIHLVFITSPSHGSPIVSPRNLIVLGANSRAAVIETYLGDGEYLTNAVTEIKIGDGARLDHIKIQSESNTAFHVGTSDTRQGRDSVYHSFSYATGAALSRTNIYTLLDGDGASVTLNGLYMADGTQHVDHQTRIEHAKPSCTSHEVYKGILDGHSHGVFNGKVLVRPEAQKTDGKQSNNNLLLSPDAHVDTKPQLEIFADDVKCTHGATVGRLDDLAMFYLESRGIPPKRARTLLMYAFAAEVLEEIAVTPIREALEAAVMERVGAR